MALQAEILRVSALSNICKERCFDLMTLHFDGIQRDTFYQDLHEKEWVIVLRNADTEQIQGFSTQMVLEVELNGLLYKAVFSGDTIIHKGYWGETELMRAWGRFILALMEKYLENRLYWFLISMGYKTYRFLPVFFNEFYPRYDKATPEFEKRILDAFAYQKYPTEYDSKSGVIHPLRTKISLKPGIADINEHLLKDPHVDFFVKRNPLHTKGDELACIAKLTRENLKPIACRIIYRDKPVFCQL